MNKKTLLTLSALLAVSAAAVAAESAWRARTSCCSDPAACRPSAATAAGPGESSECCGPDGCGPVGCEPGCCAPACCSAK